jgi:3-hydroxyisobutyrate dehydrogenase-like beta-hydroxyacid dehydrogenase
MTEILGFIGLGVMGEPICRNIASKSGRPMIAFDLRTEPLERLATIGVKAASSVEAVASEADVIFLSLPAGEHVQQVVLGPGGIAEHARAGATVVDTSTAPVDIAREVAARLAERGIGFADAPVARTRAAAEQGTLSIMVGADAQLFERIRPLLAAAASDITHCGPVGCGQVVKILNNMVLFETVAALAEALAIGRRAGVDPRLLFETMAKGSADSFALRNHGLKAMVPGVFPESAFATEYALKDLGYALRLAEQTGVAPRGARVVEKILGETRDMGFGKAYFPALVNVIEAGAADRS